MVNEQQLAMLTTSLPPIISPYVDSSVFMAHVKRETTPSRNTTRLDITTNLLAGAQNGKYKIYTSTLTIAEVRRLNEAKKQLEPNELPTVNALFNEFMEHDWIIPIEVSREIAEKAQEIGATYTFELSARTIYRISPTDAVHIATAILFKS